MKRRWISTTGASLSEVLVAMAIVMSIGTATTKGMVFTTNLVGENTLQDEATVLAQQAVERLRTTSFDAIESATSTSANGRYTITQTVNPDTPEEGMKQITVKVSWTWKGQTRSYDVATVFAKLTKS